MTNTKSEPKTVVIGGGTGLSTMLRGLKKATGKLTAIVTVADDGGGSGVLRAELGMPPPGDIRNCIQALANTEPAMEALLSYRFTEGTLRGQSFGNLFLAALNGMSASFDEAVRKMGEVLALTGRVLPVTNEDIHLLAEFTDGRKVLGESKIADHKRDSVIGRICLVPDAVTALPECIRAIEDAELIVLGPGSLYTSIIPNLLVDGISAAIAKSEAVRVYVLNVMTQAGETEGYAASDHIRALFDHSGEKLVDYCLANVRQMPPEILERYRGEGAEPCVIDSANLNALGVELVTGEISATGDIYARHDPDALAAALMELYRNYSPTKIYNR